LASVDAIGIHQGATHPNPAAQILKRDQCAISLHNHFAIQFVVMAAVLTSHDNEIASNAAECFPIGRGFFSYLPHFVRLWTTIEYHVDFVF